MRLRRLAGYARTFTSWRRGRTRLAYAPEDISIELTNICNFRCCFCPQSDPDHTAHAHRTVLSPEAADHILGALRRGGVTTDLLHWTLDGEPFVNRGMDTVCRSALGYGFRYFIFSTNGFFASPERLRCLPPADYTLVVDFAADQEFFETYRGTPTSWARVVENVRGVLAASDLEHVSIRLNDIATYQVTDPGELRRQHKALRALFGEHPRLDCGSHRFHTWAGLMAAPRDNAHRAYHRCFYPWASMVIASNGDVVACCRDIQRRTVLGNLLRQELDEIWNGDAAQGLRRGLVEQRLSDLPTCGTCDLPFDGAKFRPKYMISRLVKRLGVFR